MTVAPFDTLKYANTLKAAGVPEKQAEAQATVLADALAVNLKDLVTKDDLKHEVDLLRAEFVLVRAEFNGHFKVLHWMIGATIALLLGQLGLLVRLLFVRTP